jgi:hypothetical protein
MPRSKALANTVTTDRAARLCKILKLLSVSPKTRDVLLARLKVNSRAFFRDLKYLRTRGILLVNEKENYRLDEPVEDARAKIPCPDPELSLSEAVLLSRGNTSAHRKLRKLIDLIAGTDNRNISIL